MRTPSRLLAVVLIFLFVSAVYLFTFPQPNLLYAGVVLAHALIGELEAAGGGMPAVACRGDRGGEATHGRLSGRDGCPIIAWPIVSSDAAARQARRGHEMGAVGDGDGTSLSPASGAG